MNGMLGWSEQDSLIRLFQLAQLQQDPAGKLDLELFQVSMKLFVPRKHHSQQGDLCQEVSIEEMSIQGLVQLKSNNYL